MVRASTVFLLLLIGPWVGVALEEPEIEFRTPSEEISQIANQPWLPVYGVDPTKKRLMRLELENRIPTEYLAREEIRLAGLRMYEETRSRSRRVYAKGVSIVYIHSGEVLQPAGLPESLVIIQVQWSPDGENLALILERTKQTELWNIEVKSGKASRLSELEIQAAMADVMYWASDSQSLIVKTVSKHIGPKPIRSFVPSGAIIRETGGDPLPAQTHQGVLRTKWDVTLFEYYFSSQISRIRLDGPEVSIGAPGMFR